VIYLSYFSFPDREREYKFLMDEKRTCYDSFYPFKVLSENGLSKLDFEPITILYGGNGSGKTTALNVIGEMLELDRDTLYNRSNFFENYINMCDYSIINEIPEGSRVITSDDVFDFILNIRSLNSGIDARRDELFKDYLESKYSDFKFKTLEDYDQLKKVNLSRRTTQSKYVRKNVMDNVREHSNGENAFKYFVEKIEKQGLYLLDEPENSLSPDRQKELLRYIQDSARFFGSQFIIATHSPFLLSIKGARIYDLDESPVKIKKWTELANVRQYYEFFKEHEDEF
jgi:predicted ATPase